MTLRDAQDDLSEVRVLLHEPVGGRRLGQGQHTVDDGLQASGGERVPEPLPEPGDDPRLLLDRARPERRPDDGEAPGQ
jgi:hypothetical protein